MGALGELLRGSVARSLAGQGSATILFSGGTDSSLLAWLADQDSPGVELLTVSLPGGGDIARADSSARALGLTNRTVLLQENDVLLTAQAVRSRNRTLSLNDLSVQTAMALAMEHASNSAVFCGQGADELFIGYSHSRVLRGHALAERAAADLEKLLSRDLPLTNELARHARKVLYSPYLDPAFMAEVARIPWIERSPAGESKPLLRSLAKELGLPDPVVNAPKKAFQYGTGIHKLLARRLSNGTGR